MTNQKIMVFLVNNTWLAIPDLTLITHGNWTASCVVTGHLIMVLQGRVEFCSGDHAQLLNSGRAEI